MKVCYFNYIHDYKESSVGSFVHVNEFVKAFHELGHEIHTHSLHLKKENNSPIKAVLGENKLKKFLRRFYHEPKQLSFNFKFMVQEFRILKTIKPDVIVSRHAPYSFTLPILAKMFKIPLILEVNALGHLQIKKYEKFHIHYPLVAELEKLCFKLSSFITVTCEELKSILIDYKVPGAKLVVNPMGVDIEKFKPVNDSIKLRESLGLKDKVVFGFVGSMNQWHGLDILTELMLEATQRIPNIAFLLIGDGPKRDEIIKLVKRNELEEHIKVIGYVQHDEINRYINIIDVTTAIYPNLKEFFFSPLKIFEYMAAARPTIATDIGQIGKVINHGVNGFLVNPNNRDSILELFAKLTNDNVQRNKVGLEARNFVMNNYTWRHNASIVYEIANSLSNRTIKSN